MSHLIWNREDWGNKVLSIKLKNQNCTKWPSGNVINYTQEGRGEKLVEPNSPNKPWGTGAEVKLHWRNQCSANQLNHLHLVSLGLLNLYITGPQSFLACEPLKLSNAFSWTFVRSCLCVWTDQKGSSQIRLFNFKSPDKVKLSNIS